MKLRDRVRTAGFPASIKDISTDQTTKSPEAELPLADAADAADPAARDVLVPLEPDQELRLHTQLKDVAFGLHIKVLVARSRLDQVRMRAAVEAVFAAHPELGTVFEPSFDGWIARPGGGWSWAVEPPGVAAVDVITRQRARFDIRTGRVFTASLIPGAPDRLVLSASQLCMDGLSWQVVVEDLATAYRDGVPAKAEHAFAYARELRNQRS